MLGLSQPAWFAALTAMALAAPGDTRDWPMYNHDILGTRFNPSETALTPGKVVKLEEKWRFPAKDSKETIGVVHATPTVVNGYVYFGTNTNPTFYKLTPDGKVKWSYKPTGRAAQANQQRGGGGNRSGNRLPVGDGIMSSALVTEDSVYFADLAGMVYSLDRFTGKEQWKLDTKSENFPEPHPFNCLFASPILVDGKLIIAGGAFEHADGARTPTYDCTGRGYVAALDPASGKVVWKYNVGPKPGPLDPPVKIRDSWGEHVFKFGPATSSIWCTPSYDEATHTIFFGTDTNNAPRQPTADDPRLYTIHTCALIAVDVRSGAEKWVTQINPNDVWNYGLRAYDPKESRYKDQSIGDTPKIYTITYDGKPTKAVGAGCKDGGYYVCRASDGKLLFHTPVYRGKPSYPLEPLPDPRMLALPSPIGGLQTGCATDGQFVYTNGIDSLRMGTQESQILGLMGAPAQTGGRVVSISLDTQTERWRHERPKVASVGGPPPARVYKDVGDPVGAGIAVGGGVVYFTTSVSNKLVALDASKGAVLREIDLGPVWSGPSLSRGRVYVGTGNTLFMSVDPFPKKYTGSVISFGLPGEDEVSKMGSGKE